MTDSDGKVLAKPRRLRLLDLFCGAGGAAMGYARAGFEVVGVDIKPQPRYPFEFVQSDAFEPLADPVFMRYIDAIHASPPCRGYSDMQHMPTAKPYPMLIEPVRRLLTATRLPYVIENVDGAPLLDPIVLCGTMFPGLRVLRHRLFESNMKLEPPAHGAHPLVFTHDRRKAHRGRLDQDTAFVQVTGGGNASVANKRSAMGIDWMIGRELNEAIPPAYTEFIGRQIVPTLAWSSVA